MEILWYYIDKGVTDVKTSVNINRRSIMREKGKRRKVRRILAMFLAVVIFATSADLTVLAAGADDKSAGTAATGEEGAAPVPNEVYGENVPEGTNEVYEETGSSAQGAEAEAEGQGSCPAPDRSK